MVLVIDGKDFGFSQMYMSHIKEMLRFNSKVHGGRTYCIVGINVNMIVLSTLKTVMSTFVDSAHQKKLRLLGSDFKEEMAKLIDSNNLPVEYGGTKLSLDA
jgi:hypothetical protein